MIGKIIKGIGGFYTIACEDSKYICKAKGIFRKHNIKPMIGDDVVFSPPTTEEEEGVIEQILDRKNSPLRPAVANVDQILIVFAIKSPDLQLYLLDKYLVMMARWNVPVAIVFNKIDLVSDEDILKYVGLYSDIGYKTFACSAKEGSGLDEIKGFMLGKTTALAGPSGVGKSTLTNILCPAATMQTGLLSQKINRGKQTTRHSELFVVDYNTYLCDTPGFTSLYLLDIERKDLQLYFEEFINHIGKCKYNGCIHISEPDCSVKNAVGDASIARSRYDNYKKMLDEINERKYK